MRIFIISLKNDKDRRNIIQNRLVELGVDFEFFDAVDARVTIPSEFESRIDRDLAKKRLGRDMTNAEFGCALSHSLVYQKIVNECIEDSFIIEDDTLFDDAFSIMIKERILENQNKGFVVFNHYKVRRFFWDFGEKLYNEYRMYKAVDEVYCTGGYYIDLAHATILWDATKVISYCADWSIDLRNMAFFVSPRMVQQPSFEDNNSSLESERNNANSSMRSNARIARENNIVFKMLFFPIYLLCLLPRIVLRKPVQKKIRNFLGVWISARFEGR